MKILEIGNFFQTTSKINYCSHATLFEYDAIIIDFDSLLSHTSEGGTFQVYFKRRKDLEEFTSYKNIPIIYFAPLPKDIKLNINGMWNGYTFEAFCPIPQIHVVRESGNTIEVLQGTIFTEFLTKYRHHFGYNSYFQTGHGTTIIETPFAKKVLGFFTKDCIFLPPPKTSVLEFEKSFLEELMAVTKSITGSYEESELPDWAKSYFLPKEDEMGSKINETNTQISALKTILDENQRKLADISSVKKIFTGTGKELENVAGRIFKEIGFEILETEKNRDDLILKYKDRIAVVEIKGVTKSAAEKHATQLEKWSANYHQENNVFPKPILLVNSFNDLPLHERTEAAFPDQMIKYSTSRNHCLMTTIQLLGIYYSLLEDDTQKDKLIESIFNCSGVYQDLNDWRKFIIHKP